MLILPQHSVMPYDRKISQPSSPTARRSTAGDCGLPPHDSRRRLEVSAVGSSGLATSMASLRVEGGRRKRMEGRVALGIPSARGEGGHCCRCMGQVDQTVPKLGGSVKV